MSVELFTGDCRQAPDAWNGRVHCVVTSPPYWGLRKYEGIPDAVWADGWVGQLGLEPTLDGYVAHIVEVFDAVARVLRPDGVVWLNLGDCYAGGGSTTRKSHDPTHWVEKSGLMSAHVGAEGRPFKPSPTASALKPKDLCGVPWRVAFALQARGWYLRAAVPWAKRNCLPSSVRDRPTVATETVFLLAHPDSGGRYFYDVHATRVASTRQLRDADLLFDSLRRVLDGGEGLLHAPDDGVNGACVADNHAVPLALVVNPRPCTWEFCGACGTLYEGKDRSALKRAWKAAGKGPDGEPLRSCTACDATDGWVGHFAQFPRELVRPLILASTNAAGVCGGCGAPWRRVTERKAKRPGVGQAAPPRARDGGITPQDGLERTGLSHKKYDEWLAANPRETVGWEPGCACDAGPPVPATVLDPFGGAGNAVLEALALGRSALYADASASYAAVASARMRMPPSASSVRPDSTVAESKTSRQDTLFEVLS